MTTDGTSAFGELLRRYRTAAALSQEELAARAGLSLRGVSDLERGHRRAPRLETVRLLAEACGLAQPARAALLAARGAAPTAPGQAPPSVAVERPPLPTPPAPPALEGSLVGRAAEFTTLVERYHAAGRGRPQAVVLQG